MPSQMRPPDGGHGDTRIASVSMTTRYEAAVVGLFPHRQAWTRGSPRLECLGVGPSVRTDPLEQVEDQRVDGLGLRAFRALNRHDGPFAQQATRAYHRHSTPNRGVRVRRQRGWEASRTRESGTPTRPVHARSRQLRSARGIPARRALWTRVRRRRSVPRQPDRARAVELVGERPLSSVARAPVRGGLAGAESRRAAALGLVAVLAGLLGYFMMTVSPFEGVPADRFASALLAMARANRLWVAGGLLTAPLYGLLGRRWRIHRSWGSAAALAGCVCLEPFARWAVGRPPASNAVSLAEVAVGLCLAGYLLASRVRRRVPG